MEEQGSVPATNGTAQPKSKRKRNRKKNGNTKKDPPAAASQSEIVESRSTTSAGKDTLGHVYSSHEHMWQAELKRKQKEATITEDTSEWYTTAGKFLILNLEFQTNLTAHPQRNTGRQGYIPALT